MRVPYVDLAAQHAPLKEKLLRAVERVLDGGDFILGSAVSEFEESLARYCGTRFAIGLNSGTDALFLTLKAWGIGPGDEVVLPPNSFLASASAVAATGATPVFADIREDLNIDPAKAAAALTPRTKALMAVHLTGRPADMDALRSAVEGKGIKIIEDAAQAIGAEYGGRKAGALADAGCFSLHPLKTLNACGDGGAVTTDDPDLARTLRELRNIGLRNRDESDAWGFNSRLDTIQAAILSVKLAELDGWLAERRRNAAFYDKRLAGLVETPPSEGKARSAFHTYVIQCDRRDGLQSFLTEHGVGSKVHYPIPIHLQRAASGLGKGPGSYPVCERAAGRILSLPVYQGMTPEALDFVADRVAAFVKWRPG